MKTILLKIALYITWIVLLPLFTSGQTTANIKTPARVKDNNLRAVQALLLKWQCPRFKFESDWEEPWEQLIKVDEKNQQIIYRVRDYQENGTDTNWMATHYIPLMEIDSITQNYKDSTLTFYTAKYKIDTWQLNYPAVKNDKVAMYMQIGKVRNLAGQLWGFIREYQIKRKSKN